MQISERQCPLDSNVKITIEIALGTTEKVSQCNIQRKRKFHPIYSSVVFMYNNNDNNDNNKTGWPTSKTVNNRP